MIGLQGLGPNWRWENSNENIWNNFRVFNMSHDWYLSKPIIIKIKACEWALFLYFAFKWLKCLSNYLESFKGYGPIKTLFRKKRFEINFFVQRKASKFAIFIEKEKQCSFFFVFHLEQLLKLFAWQKSWSQTSFFWRVI